MTVVEPGSDHRRERSLVQIRGAPGEGLRSPFSRARTHGTREKAVHATLDFLLGAIYAMVWARQEGFNDRVGRPDIEPIGRRAGDLESGSVRLDGKWIAGFHFNNALARIAATQERAARIAEGYGLPPGRAQAILRRTQPATPMADCVRDEVNRLKHRPDGHFDGRQVTFSAAVEAIGELLSVAESWEA